MNDNRLTFVCQIYAEFGEGLIPVECRSEKIFPREGLNREPYSYTVDIPKSGIVNAQSLDADGMFTGIRSLVFIQNRTGVQLNVRPTDAEQKIIDAADAIMSVNGVETARIRAKAPMLFEPADISRLCVHAPNSAVRLRITIIPLDK